jgi:hypothetical protein
VKTRRYTIIMSGMAPTQAVVLIGMLLLGALVHFSGSDALSAQTREQCNKCCESQGHDEYYMDQCKLQCFRNPDSCTGKKTGAAAQPEATPTPRPAPVAKPAQREQPYGAQPVPREQPPAMQPAPREQQPVAQRPAGPPARTTFQFMWPNPLTLVPGREADAAAQILGLNGIPPQHPNYPVAAQSVQAVLVEFARNNPAGGSLPTAQLEKIIKQLR